MAIGTRGDIQPLLALAVGLQRTGRHKVRLITPDDFGELVAAHGVDHCPLGMDARLLLGTGHLAAGLESGRNTLLWVTQILRTMRPALERLMENTWQACQGAEAIVFSTMGLGAYHVAERLGVPCYWALPFPGMARTRAFPSVVFPALRLGRRLCGAYNLWTHTVAEWFMQQLTGRFLNRWRRRHGLAVIPVSTWPYGGRRGCPAAILFSYSPLVLPSPPDWGDHVHVTGYWFLDSAPGWKPSARLVNYLASGPPPVYVGFGSMPQRDPWRTAQLVRRALQLSRQRGVMVAGWSGLPDRDPAAQPTDLLVLDAVPHAWLLPHTAAVVHHGGSGTTGAGLRAGVPSVLVPHAGDQLLWARRVMELGVGPRPIPRRRLTAERLAAAMTRAVTDQEMRAQAAELGERIRDEGGVERAIAVIEGKGVYRGCSAG